MKPRDVSTNSLNNLLTHSYLLFACLFIHSLIYFLIQSFASLPTFSIIDSLIHSVPSSRIIFRLLLVKIGFFCIRLVCRMRRRWTASTEASRGSFCSRTTFRQSSRSVIWYNLLTHSFAHLRTHLLTHP